MEIELAELTVTASGNRVIEDVSLHAGSGERIGLVGPNGSGKSSTLRCLFRALTPSHGDIRIGERALRAMSLRESAQLLAALTQESQSEFDFTVAEVVAMGRTAHPRGWADEEICARALHEVDCTHLAMRGYQSLSGGEKQRVLIARAFAQQPHVLVLDEPTNHLDIRHQLEILELVRRLGVTTLAALHDLNLAASWCDRVYVLDEGRVVAGGPPRRVLDPETVREVFGVNVHVVDHPASGVPQLLFDTHHAPAMAGN